MFWDEREVRTKGLSHVSGCTVSAGSLCGNIVDYALQAAKHVSAVLKYMVLFVSYPTNARSSGTNVRETGMISLQFERRS